MFLSYDVYDVRDGSTELNFFSMLWSSHGFKLFYYMFVPFLDFSQFVLLPERQHKQSCKIMYLISDDW